MGAVEVGRATNRPFTSALTLVSLNRLFGVNQMSHDNNNSAPVSGTLKTISILLILLFLAVSVYHAGSFMYRTTAEGWQRHAMIATVFGLLASSHCLAHMVGQGIKQGLIIVALLCGATVVPIELFSVATSSAALNSRVVDSVRRENHSSPEYKAALRTVDNYQKQIEQLMASAEKLPTTYVTKRESIHNKIAVLQTRQDRAQREANKVNVSTTGAVYSSLTDSTGLTAQDVSATAAIMLSVTPIVLGIGFAALSGRRKTFIEPVKADSGKKQSRRLHAV